MSNYMDRYLDWLESTTPEERLGRSADDGLCDACWGSGWLAQFITPCPDCKGTGNRLQ